MENLMMEEGERIIKGGKTDEVRDGNGQVTKVATNASTLSDFRK